MTLTVPAAEPALLGPLRTTGPAPLVAQSAPGVAVVLTLADRLRMVVGEAKDDRRLRRACIALGDLAGLPDVTAAAEALLDPSGPGGGTDLSTSLCVADLWPDGRVELVLQDAPPAVVLAPDGPARLLVAPAGTGGTAAELRPGEVLLLCSASFLEDPPPVLGTMRGATAPGAEDLEMLRRTLTDTCVSGATVTVRMPMRG